VGKLKRKESMLLATFGPALGDYFDRLIVTMAVCFTYGSLCS
jgi:hypothetical protein